jgi:hypothetical protein
MLRHRLAVEHRARLLPLAGDRDRAGTRGDVAQADGERLAHPQASVRHERHQRDVAKPNERLAIGRGEKRRQFFAGEGLDLFLNLLRLGHPLHRRDVHPLLLHTPPEEGLEDSMVRLH